MAKTATAGRPLKTRITQGWRTGLALRDAFVCIGTLVIVAEIALIGLFTWRTANAVEPASMLQRALGIEPQGPPLAIGGQAWVRHVTADLNPTPQYSLQHQRLWAFQPVTILNGVRMGNEDWLQVTGTLLNRKTFTGWVLADRVQTNDPTAGAVDEPGWVVVTHPQGASLLSAPELQAAPWSPPAPKGQRLRKLRRLPRGGFGNDLKDYLLIENPGPGGRRGAAWVYELHVAPATGP